MANQRRVSQVSDLSGMVPTAQLLGPGFGAIAQASTGSSAPIIDTRTLGKPDIFKGDASSYADWSFILKAYLSCLDARFLDFIQKIETSTVNLPNRSLSESEKALSCQLYFVLVMLLRGRPLDIVQNVGSGEGAESLRRLEELYHPRIASRFVGSLSLILNTKFSGNDLESELEGFEKNIRRYEQESGKTIDDQMLAGIILNGIQNTELRSHIIRNSYRLTTYSAMRSELLEMARTNRVLSQMPVPMDIGALPNKKGKGKGGKTGSKGKDSGKSTKGGKSKDGKGKSSTNSENPHKDKQCRYCHKFGHIKADCRKLQNDEKNGKTNKGSGKHRPHAGAPSPDEEPEPMGASPDLIAGVFDAGQEVLVDSGAGSHLFAKGFDKHAVEIDAKPDNGMVTVTGQPLSTGRKKRSVFKAGSSKFSIEYSESDKVNFSVLSAGKAAEKGTWTVIGPQQQCMILGKDANKLKKALAETAKINLIKKRGVYWLPIEATTAKSAARPIAALKSTNPSRSNKLDAGSTAPAPCTAPCRLHDRTEAGSTAPLVAAVRPARNAVPAEQLEPQEGEEAHAEQHPQAGEGIIEEQLPRLPDEPPAENSEEPRVTRAKKIPDTVTREEYNKHMLTHLPFRSWCDHCCAGKVREDSHFKRLEPSGIEVPRVSMDYCFLGRVLDKTKAQEEITVSDLKTPEGPETEAEGVMPVLVIVDERTGSVFSQVVAKGVNEHAIHTVIEALKFCGRQRVILHTDAEPAIKALAEAVGHRWGKETQIQNAPRESHASNGNAERAILEVARQVRTVVSAMEGRYPEYKMTVTSVHYPWAVRHAGWLLTRYLIKSDGKTPYERLRGREFKGEVAECFEVVHYKLADSQRGKLDAQSAIGVWLGKSLQSDEHYIGTTDGIRRCRSIWRRPENRRWSLEHLTKTKGSPWQPRGVPTVMPGTPGGVVAPGTPGRQRSVYITLDRQIRHGPTPGCPGCSCRADDPKPHNKECKARFEGLIGHEKAEAARRTSQQQESDVEMPGGIFDDDEPEHAHQPRAVRRKTITTFESAGGTATQSAASTADGAAGGPAHQGSASDTANKRIAGSTASPHRRQAEEEIVEQALKRNKPTPAQGDKRPPDQPVDVFEQEHNPNAGLPELICGLPSLHDIPIAGYPDWGRLDEIPAYDERTGVPLPLEKVKRARGRELDKMEEHQVKVNITWEKARELGLKIVKSRWVDGWKELPDDKDGVRSRCVAQEINTHQRDDVYSGTPPLKCHRMVISSAATRRPGQTGKKLVARYDISVAFFHATSTDGIAVIPPEDLYDGIHLWMLLKAMNGTREASKRWSQHVEDVVTTKGGFMPVKNVCGLYYQPEWQVTLSCHGDDFLAEGMAVDLEKLDALMVENFETKVLPKIGPADAGGETNSGSHLHRIIKWCDGSQEGFTWEADPKYAKSLVKAMNLEGCKGVDTPSSKECGKEDRQALELLKPEEAKEFRSLAGTALYLSLDRPSIQFAMSEISSGMSAPTRLHWLKLKRLVRYLAKYPTEIWVFEIQDQPSEYCVYTDSDWASDRQTRKSMSSYAEKFGEHLVETSCARQTVVALSSGEAEFYAMTRGAAAGLMSQQILQSIGFSKLDLSLLTDSTAAKGIANRSGSGKLKHLDIKDLWLQDVVRANRLRIKKEPSASNWSDLGTKSLTGTRIGELLQIMPLTRRGIVVACLLCQVCVANGQNEDQQNGSGFWWYFVFVHVMAVLGILSLLQRAYDAIAYRTVQRTVDRSCQTESRPTRTDESQKGKGQGKTNTAPSGHGGASEMSSESSRTSTDVRRRSQLEDRVFIIGGGQRFHNESCGMVRANLSRVRGVSRREALRAGLTNCQQCGG